MILLLHEEKENRRTGSGLHKLINIWTGAHLVPLKKGPCMDYCSCSSMDFLLACVVPWTVPFDRRILAVGGSDDDDGDSSFGEGAIGSRHILETGRVYFP